MEESKQEGNIEKKKKLFPFYEISDKGAYCNKG